MSDKQKAKPVEIGFVLEYNLCRWKISGPIEQHDDGKFYPCHVQGVHPDVRGLGSYIPAGYVHRVWNQHVKREERIAEYHRSLEDKTEEHTN